VFEETSLAVEVERLLFTAPDMPGGIYDFVRTYLCRRCGGEVQFGVHPACDASIQEADWFDLRDPAGWPPLIANDPITHRWLQTLRSTLGYGSTPTP
jgi:hypothetical protein